MKTRSNAGFSLVEVLVAIVLLGIMAVPTCTGLVMSVRLNDKTDQVMRSQLAVSSAVETLMAEGITHASDTYDVVDDVDRFPGVTVVTEDAGGMFYKVTVTSEEETSVYVTTFIRKGGSGA